MHSEDKFSVDFSKVFIASKSFYFPPFILNLFDPKISNVNYIFVSKD